MKLIVDRLNFVSRYAQLKAKQISLPLLLAFILCSVSIDASKPIQKNTKPICEPGPWVSRVDMPSRGQIYIVTLHIQKKGDNLTGEIVADVLLGGMKSVKSSCGVGEHYYRVSMPAKGTLKGNDMIFGGTSIRSMKLICGVDIFSKGDYRLDHFAGRIKGDKYLAKWLEVGDDEVVFTLQKKCKNP